MKKFRNAIISIMMAMVLFGCGKNLESKVIGTWSMPLASDYGTVTYIYEFKEDGKMEASITLMGMEKSSEGVWRLEGDTIVASVGGDNVQFTVKESGNSVSLTYKGVTLTKE